MYCWNDIRDSMDPCMTGEREYLQTWKWKGISLMGILFICYDLRSFHALSRSVKTVHNLPLLFRYEFIYFHIWLKFLFLCSMSIRKLSVYVILYDKEFVVASWKPYSLETILLIDCFTCKYAGHFYDFITLTWYRSNHTVQ